MRPGGIRSSPRRRGPPFQPTLGVHSYIPLPLMNGEAHWPGCCGTEEACVDSASGRRRPRRRRICRRWRPATLLTVRDLTIRPRGCHVRRWSVSDNPRDGRTAVRSDAPALDCATLTRTYESPAHRAKYPYAKVTDMLRERAKARTGCSFTVPGRKAWNPSKALLQSVRSCGMV